jgi:hypothetical protein
MARRNECPARYPDHQHLVAPQGSPSSRLPRSRATAAIPPGPRIVGERARGEHLPQARPPQLDLRPQPMLPVSRTSLGRLRQVLKPANELAHAGTISIRASCNRCPAKRRNGQKSGEISGVGGML